MKQNENRNFGSHYRAVNGRTHVNTDTQALASMNESTYTNKHTIPRVRKPLLNVQALDQREYGKALSIAYAIILNPKNSTNAQLP